MALARYALVQCLWEGSFTQQPGDWYMLIPMERVPDDVAEEMRRANGKFEVRDDPAFRALEDFLKTCADCESPKREVVVPPGAAVVLVCQFFERTTKPVVESSV